MWKELDDLMADLFKLQTDITECEKQKITALTHTVASKAKNKDGPLILSTEIGISVSDEQVALSNLTM